jgi:hypothetical protein
LAQFDAPVRFVTALAVTPRRDRSLFFAQRDIFAVSNNTAAYHQAGNRNCPEAAGAFPEEKSAHCLKHARRNVVFGNHAECAPSTETKTAFNSEVCLNIHRNDGSNHKKNWSESDPAKVYDRILL